jgi:hypothetical protein
MPPPPVTFQSPVVQEEPTIKHVPVPPILAAVESVTTAPATTVAAVAADTMEVVPVPVAPAAAAIVPEVPLFGRGQRIKRHVALMASRNEVTNIVDFSHFGLIASLSEDLSKYGEAGEAALLKEAKQMVDLVVFEGTDIAIKYHTLPSHTKREILNVRGYLEEKRDGRLKARIIGGTGSSRQDRTQYPDVSSPTVRPETVQILIKVAATKGNNLAVMDVPGAYLHAPMQDMRLGSEPDTPRYVKVTGLLARLFVRLVPSWDEFLSEDGILVLKLNKALYGLVESARLWNIEIRGTLEGAGFTQSAQDPCLFIHQSKGITLVIYVDDFLLSYRKEKDLYWLQSLLEKKYGKPRVQMGECVDYLNIRIRKLTADFGEYKAGSFVIDQSDYCRNMLEKYDIQGMEDMPHDDEFFSSDPESPPLSTAGAARYVSMAMSLLFTCNRARSDVFLHTSLLCTKLKNPTEQDLTKLERVLRYIAGTIDFGIAYGSGDVDLQVFAWIDASYATHDDAKGHSGTVISVGAVPGSNGSVVYVKSRKQKLVARSSTEAELIALHDGLPQVVWTRNVLEELGYAQIPAEVYQDNKSTIFMAEAGHGNHHRSKHIAVRFFYAKGLIDHDVIRIKHLGTDLMLADTFTKALSRRKFIAMRGQTMVDLSALSA